MRPLACALLLLTTAGPASAQLADLRIETGTGTHASAAVELGGAAYSIDALGVLGATVHRTAAGARVLLFGDTLLFWDTSPFFRRGDALYQLAFPARSVAGALRLPEQFFIEWLPANYAERLEYRGGVLRARGEALAAASGAAAGSRAASPVERRVVVIDPGHGGVDPGKIAANGLREKDLTLTIGTRLAELLRARGYEVHMTRTTDTLVPLDERPRLANGWKDGRAASLFLSIHANSADSRAAAGFETFFLAEARTEDERRVAEIENAAVRFETDAPAPLPEVEYILHHLRNDFYQRASNDLAQVVQHRLADFHPGRDRGVKQAGFRVLVGAYMPAVLIEVGFLSNAQEARLLATGAFQQELARGIAEAVDRYFAEHEHLLITERR